MAFTVLTTANNLQTAATAGSPGDIFFLSAGTYLNQSVLPQDGQQFIGQSADDTILDGGGVTTDAFHYQDPTHPKAVHLETLTIQNYTGGAGRAAVLADNAYAWTLDGIRILGTTAGRGLEPGPGMRIRQCIIGNCFLAGLVASSVNGLRIKGLELFNNNTSHNNPDTPTGEGAGMKLGTCTDVELEDVFAHDNYGPGVWLDNDCYKVTILKGTTLRNTHRGFQIEISDTVTLVGTTSLLDGIGQALPGAAGIFNSSSSNVELAGCRVYRCANGISGFTDARGSGPRGVREINNWNVHDCEVIQQSGMLAGLVQNVSNNAFFTSKGNTFDGNRYTQLGDSPNFRWNNLSPTWPQWLAYSLDANGSMRNLIQR